MIAIRDEIDRVEAGEWPADDNPLAHAPHTAADVARRRLGPRRTPASVAAFPVAPLRTDKYWPPVGRIDSAYGDRNVMCSCPPVTDWRRRLRGREQRPRPGRAPQPQHDPGERTYLVMSRKLALRAADLT